MIRRVTPILSIIKEIPTDDHMTPSEKKMQPFTFDETKIPASEHVPYKKQTRENGVPTRYQMSCLYILSLEKILSNIMLINLIGN